MKAWLLNGVSDLSQTNSPLVLGEILLPVPKGHQVLIKVSCCGVCHTPVWKTVLSALSHLRPGGKLVINAIRKKSSDQEESQKDQNFLFFDKKEVVSYIS